MMCIKRYGYLFDKICSYDNLLEAHRRASEGKRWYEEVKMVDSNLEYYLTEIQRMLLNGEFKTSEYVKEIKEENGKQRNIYKLPYYPDRIVQWAILLVIDEYLIKHMIDYTCSAIPGRGIHTLVKKIKEDLKNEQEAKYCLKLDVKKYYESIDHEIAKQKFARKFKDKQLLNVINEIIDSIDTSPTTPKTGIPIGNYLSQYVGNFYLSDFDHWMKEVKHCKYYYRYMDDIVILSSSKEHLHQLRLEIEEYLTNNLKLKIKENWQVFPVDVRGIDFVGYRFFRKYTLLRKRTQKNMIKKLRKMKNKDKLDSHDFFCIFSYVGWTNHCVNKGFDTKYFIPLQNAINEVYCRELRGGNYNGVFRIHRK